MKKTNNQSLGYDYPEANITVNRNRVRQYGEIVYLPNESEFEIELYNPKSISVLAKIKINGQYISNSGIVVKPAQRIYLERYIDTSRKYKFSVYTIDGNNQKNLEAIASNGEVVVEFYAEIIPTSVIYRQNVYTNHVVLWHSTYEPFNCQGNYYYSTPINNPSLVVNEDNFVQPTYNNGSTIYTSNALLNNIETGRVERGNESDQNFVESYNSFSPTMSHSIKIKILPESQRPIESGDLRIYCGCGYRIRKSSWKFCPSCGNNLE